MKRRNKEKIRKWVVVAIILFMAFMLVLAYMPMLFVPDEGERGDGPAGERPVSTSTRSTLPN